MINEIDKSLARLNKKIRERTQHTKIRNEIENISVDLAETNKKKTIRNTINNCRLNILKSGMK